MKKIRSTSIIAGILSATILATSVLSASAESGNTYSLQSPAEQSQSTENYIDNFAIMPKYVADSEVNFITTEGGAENTTPEWVKSLVIAEVNIDTVSTDGMFTGMIKALDHLAETGINGIWLTPIYDGIPLKNSYANYGPNTVSKQLTGKDDYSEGWQVVKEFVDEAHNRNIRVFFDIVTWGVCTTENNNTEILSEWLKDDATISEAYGKDGIEIKAFDWESTDLNSDGKTIADWFKDQMVNIITTTGADGFRADCGSQFCGTQLFKDVRSTLTNNGRKIAIFSECAEVRDGTFDFEEHSISNELDGKFDNMADTYINNNIVDAVKNGTTLGTTNMDSDIKGTGRFYSSLISCHDSSSYSSDNLVNIGYCAVLAPFIPIWYLGEEFNNSLNTASNQLYRNSINWGLVDTNRDYFEDVKQLVRIRRTYSDIFEYETANHRNTNICKVTSTAGDVTNSLQAYARYANGKAVIVVPNNTYDRAKFEITIPYTDANLTAGNYQITDLMNCGVITSGASTSLTSFSATVEAGEVGVYLIEKYTTFTKTTATNVASSEYYDITLVADNEIKVGSDWWSKNLQHVASNATDEHNALAQLIRDNIYINGMSIDEALKIADNKVDSTQVIANDGKNFIIKIKKTDNPYNLDPISYFTLEIKDGISLNGYAIKAQKYYVTKNTGKDWNANFKSMGETANIVSAKWVGGEITLETDKVIESADISSVAENILIDDTVVTTDNVTVSANKIYIKYDTTTDFNLQVKSGITLNNKEIMPARYTFTYYDAVTERTVPESSIEDALTVSNVLVQSTAEVCSSDGHQEAGWYVLIQYSDTITTGLVNYYLNHLQVQHDSSNPYGTTVCNSIKLNGKTLTECIGSDVYTDFHVGIAGSNSEILRIAIPKENDFGFDGNRDFTVEVKEGITFTCNDSTTSLSPVVVNYTAAYAIGELVVDAANRVKLDNNLIFIYFDNPFNNDADNKAQDVSSGSTAIEYQTSLDLINHIKINGETLHEIFVRSDNNYAVMVKLGTTGTQGYISLNMNTESLKSDVSNNRFTVEFVEGFVFDGYSIPRTVCTKDNKISTGFWVEQGGFTNGTVEPRRAAGDWSTKDNILEAGAEFYGNVKPNANYQLKAGSLTYSYLYKGEKKEVSLLETKNGTQFYHNIADVVGQIDAEFVKIGENVNFATVGATSNKNGNGLRFVTRMYLDNIDFENNKVIINDSEYSIVDYGTLIGLEKTNLTLETSIKAKCEPMVYRNIGGVFVDFTAELVNVDSTNFDTEFSACGYFTYADSQGEEITVYTDVITRSVNGVN